MPQCPVCDDQYDAGNSLRSHARDAHTGCSYCGETFEQTDALYRHWLAVHPEKLDSRAEQEATDAVGELSFEERRRHGGLGNALSGGVNRRTVLGGLAALGVGGFGAAAATGAFDGAEPQPLSEHPAGKAIDSQPILGDGLDETAATIVAFEDPSCTSCARFEQQVLPSLREKHIATGNVSFVYRGIPIIYPWGQEATRVLEAVYAASPEAFEPVKSAYYDQQRRFDKQTVWSESSALINELDIGLNGKDIVNTAQTDEAVERAVQTDLSASRSAGVGSTPTFFLFRNGEYQSKIVGPQRLSVFESALNL